MPFTQRLQFLLEKYDALILHGFGAFYARYQTAQWHPVTHRIIPPQKEITFNRSIQQTDGVLENEFKGSFELSNEESQELVKGMVDFLLEELHHHKKLVFEGVGEILLRPDGSWRFLPFEENKILPDSFGLAPIQVRPVLRYSSTPKPDTHLFLEQDNIHANPKKSFPWKSVAATFALLTLASTMFFFNPFSDQSTSAHHTAQIIQTQPKTSFDSIKKIEVKKNDTTEQVVIEKEIEIEAPTEAVIKEPSTGFYIIVGSTTSEKEAEKLAISKHWTALHFPELGRYRLAAQRFETHEEAQMALGKIRSEIEAQAWILKH